MKDEWIRASIFVVVVLTLLAAGQASAQFESEPVDTSGVEAYSVALSAYMKGEHATAERLFESIVEADRKAPETIKAHYFLARSRMKLRKWEEASAGMIRIYSIDPIFYHQWNCDFLLGEARAAMGLD
jgi:TolA-binding protein